MRLLRLRLAAGLLLGARAPTTYGYGPPLIGRTAIGGVTGRFRRRQYHAR